MANIYVSGLVNTETTVKVAQFPIPYYPIDYPFFGVGTSVSGVGYNIARALRTLGDEVTLTSFLGRDLQAEVIETQLRRDGLPTDGLLRDLAETPSSVVLSDGEGRRQIYCDLKDIQERTYPCDAEKLAKCDLAAACNINFNRPLLALAKSLGKPIATDVHVLRDVEDEYNRDFMEAADILFLSDEGLPCGPREFLARLEERYHNAILVLGRGDKGALLYVRDRDTFYDLPAVPAERVENTVGAGDALFSAFLHFYCKGLDPVEALWHSQVFASAKIGTAGGAQGFLTEREVLERRSRLL